MAVRAGYYLLSVASYFVLSPDEKHGLAWHQHPRAFGMRLNFEPGLVADEPELRWLSERDEPSDWVMTVDAVRLVSSRVREVFEGFIAEREGVQWLPGILQTPDGQERPYFVPHFATRHDLLDEAATVWGPGGPIRWVLSAEKAEGLNVFTLPEMNDIVFVTPAVLDALRASGASGFDVASARVV